MKVLGQTLVAAALSAGWLWAQNVNVGMGMATPHTSSALPGIGVPGQSSKKGLIQIIRCAFHGMPIFGP